MDCSREYKSVYIVASYNDEKACFEGVISVDGKRIEADNYAHFCQQFHDYVDEYIYKEYIEKDKRIARLEKEIKFLKIKLNNFTKDKDSTYSEEEPLPFDDETWFPEE